MKYEFTEEQLSSILLDAVRAGQNNFDEKGNYIGHSAETSRDYVLGNIKSQTLQSKPPIRKDEVSRKLYDWLFMNPRPKAQTYFTAGWERNIANEIEFRMTKLEEALRRILKEPHGCRFCDSGKLRVPNKPEKGHDEDCPYLIASKLLNNE